MEQNNCYVYVLKHVENSNKVFYVGRGTLYHDQFDRYTEHLRKAKQGSQLYVHRKIRKIQQEGGQIMFDIIATGLDFTASQNMERRLVASYGLDNLTNITEGGDDHPLKDASPERRESFIQRIKDGMATRQVFLHKGDNETWNFESGVKAAEFLGVSPQAICQAARRKRTTKGYHVTLGQVLPPKNNYS